MAANHAYKSGVDGFILGHLLATRAGRVPRIVHHGGQPHLGGAGGRWVLTTTGLLCWWADQTGGTVRERRTRPRR